MSKHIWRGQLGCNGLGRIASERLLRQVVPDCTVVQDAACFPVEEAIALCRTACVFSDLSQIACYYPGYGCLLDKVKAYKDAVNDMKKKTKGKECQA